MQISRGNFLLQIPLLKHLCYQKVSLVELKKSFFSFFFCINTLSKRLRAIVAVISCF